MREGFQLWITEGPYTFVLSGSVGVTVENRERLADVEELGTTGRVRFSRQGKVWIAARLAHLTSVEAGVWRQAIFIDGADQPASVIVTERARLIERNAADAVRPFTVPGSALEGSPLFQGVLVGGGYTRLIIDRDSLARHAARITAP